jgi:hypothetical protein
MRWIVESALQKRRKHKLTRTTQKRCSVDEILKMYREDPNLRRSAKKQREILDRGYDIMREGLLYLKREKARKDHWPSPVKGLFVGESPPKPNPKSGEDYYFYYDDTNYLARHFKTALEKIGLKSEGSFLDYFQSLGFGLDDLSSEPLDNIPDKEKKSMRYGKPHLILLGG